MNWGSNWICILPVGPCLCLEIIISAFPWANSHLSSQRLNLSVKVSLFSLSLTGWAYLNNTPLYTNITTSASCSIEPDSLKSTKIGLYLLVAPQLCLIVIEQELVYLVLLVGPLVHYGNFLYSEFRSARILDWISWI